MTKVEVTLQDDEVKVLRGVTLSSRKLRVYNHTPYGLWVGVYFHRRNHVRRVYYRLQEPVEVHADQSVELDKTSFHCLVTRGARVFFSTEVANIATHLRGDVCKRISSHSVYFSRQVHIALDRDLLVGYNKFTYNHHDSIEATRTRLARRKPTLAAPMTPERYQELLKPNSTEDVPCIVRTLHPKPTAGTEQAAARMAEEPYNPLWRTKSAPLVTTSGKTYIPASMPLGTEEQEALENRNKHTRQGIQRLLPDLDLEGKRVPRISVCFSGGSYRALVSTLGYMRGWKESGLLDCVTYMSTLSGSCWAMALWMCYADNIDAALASMARKLERKFASHFNTEARHLLSVALHERKQLKYPTHRLMSLYSVLLSMQLLNDIPDGFLYPFSGLKQVSQVQAGLTPIPILTSGFKEPHGYEWMEITPFEVGSEYIGAYIPAAGFGSSFKAGHLYRPGPELTLSQVMSFTTSAICLTTRNLLKQIFGDMILSHLPADSKLGEMAAAALGDAERLNVTEPGHYDTTTFSDEEDFVSDDDDEHMGLDAHLFPEEEEGILDFESDPERERKEWPFEFSSDEMGYYRSHPITNSSFSQRTAVVRKASVPDSTASYVHTERSGDRSKRRGVAKRVYRFVNEYEWLADAYLISPATFPNFAYRLEGPMKSKKYVRLVDAGFAFCMPIPPLAREARKSDIIVVVEMSAPPNCEDGRSLMDAVRWCKDHDVPLPPIDQERLRVPFGEEGGDQIVVFEDPDGRPDVPTIVYMVLQKNERYGDFDPILNQHEGGFCSTFCSTMTGDEIDLLAGLATFTAQEMSEEMKDVIRRKVDQLNMPCPSSPSDSLENLMRSPRGPLSPRSTSSHSRSALRSPRDPRSPRSPRSASSHSRNGPSPRSPRVATPPSSDSPRENTP